MPRVEREDVSKMVSLPNQGFSVVDLEEYCADCPDNIGTKLDDAGKFIEYRASQSSHVTRFHQILVEPKPLLK